MRPPTPPAKWPSQWSTQVLRKLFLILSWKLLPCHFRLQILVLSSTEYILPSGVMGKAHKASRGQTGSVHLLGPLPYRSEISLPKEYHVHLRGVKLYDRTSFLPLSPWSGQRGGLTRRAVNNGFSLRPSGSVLSFSAPTINTAAERWPSNATEKEPT